MAVLRNLKVVLCTSFVWCCPIIFQEVIINECEYQRRGHAPVGTDSLCQKKQAAWDYHEDLLGTDAGAVCDLLHHVPCEQDLFGGHRI